MEKRQPGSANDMDGEQSVQTIGAIFLMHFASFSTKRTR